VSEDISLRHNNWVENPFLIKKINQKKSLFIEMTNDSCLKSLFDEMSLTDFWCSSSITNKYPILTSQVVQIRLLFHTTYPVKQNFHRMQQRRQNIATN